MQAKADHSTNNIQGWRTEEPYISIEGAMFDMLKGVEDPKTTLERVMNYAHDAIYSEIQKAEDRIFDIVQIAARESEKSTMGPEGYISFIDPKTFLQKIRSRSQQQNVASNLSTNQSGE